MSTDILILFCYLEVILTIIMIYWFNSRVTFVAISSNGRRNVCSNKKTVVNPHNLITIIFEMGDKPYIVIVDMTVVRYTVCYMVKPISTEP